MLDPDPGYHMAKQYRMLPLKSGSLCEVVNACQGVLWGWWKSNAASQYLCIDACT